MIGLFPNCMVKIQRHVGCDWDSISDEEAGLKTNESEGKFVMLDLFFGEENSFAGWGVSWIKKLKFDKDVTHVLCPKVTRV